MEQAQQAPVRAPEHKPTNGAHGAAVLPSEVAYNAPRPRRRWLSLSLGALAILSIFACGALIGYTQGPPLATLIASGQSFVRVGSEFEACFRAASNDSNLRSFFSTFARNLPTRTPGPPPTLDPTLLRTVKGSLVALTQREVVVEVLGGSRERFPLVPLAQVVAPSGTKLSQQGVLAGDSVNLLAIRLGALGGFGALIGGAGASGTLQATSPNDYAAFCIIVDVNPK